MIEQISNLLKQAGAKQMTITIQPLDGANVAVIANTQLGTDQGCPNARAALSRPLVVQGFVGEVDAFFSEQLVTYANSFTPAAVQLSSNTSAVTQGHKTQGKSDQTNPSQKESTAQSSQAAPAITSEPEDTFANGDADSL